MRSLPLLDVPADAPAPPPPPESFGAEGLPPLVDAQGRRYVYLRLSVTDRCDLRCQYCMPEGGEDDHALRPELLTFEEAARLARVFAASGIRRVRLTGGEPLVRKDVTELVELIAHTDGIANLVLTTNATRLAELARPLRRAGLDGVNVSMDTLDADRFRDLTRGGDLRKVQQGIEAAIEEGLTTKLNIVAQRGLNDDELEPLVEWAWERGITPRFIELMPLGEAAKLPSSAHLGADEIRARLMSRLSGTLTSIPNQGPARYLHAKHDPTLQVGFITAMSSSFCESCNRVRVTARGDIRACLASRRAVSLRDLVRGGATDRELAWAMHWALGAKDAGHRFSDALVDEHEHVGMSLVGG